MPPTRRSGRPAPAPAALRPRRTPAPRRPLCLALDLTLCLTLCLALCLALAAPVRAVGQDPAPASAPARPCAVVATLSDFPPYCAFIPGASPQVAEPVPVGADSTQLRGFAWEVVRDALHAAGVDIELKVAPWARTLHYLDSGQADLAFPAMHTQQRDQVYRFSREAVVRSTLRMYVRADDPQVWTGLAAWSGREVAVIQGWAYGPHWDQHTGIIPHPVFSVQQGFAMLDKGRVAGVAGYEVPFDLLLRTRGLTDRFRKLPAWDTVDEYVIARRDDPAATAHLEAFDRGMAILRSSGRLEALYAKWNISPSSQLHQ